MATHNHAGMTKAMTQVYAIDKHVARITEEVKGFGKAMAQSIAAQSSDRVNDALKELPGLKKELNICEMSLKAPLTLYAALAKDSAVMGTHRHEITRHVHHLIQLKKTLPDHEKELIDWEKKAQGAGFLDESELQKFRKLLEIFKSDSEGYRREVEKGIDAANGLAEVGQKAYNDRDDNGATAARAAIQKVESVVNAEKGRINASLDNLPRTLTEKEAEALRKIERTFLEAVDLSQASFSKLIKEDNARGRVNRIDRKKASSLLKISDNKDIDLLDKALNTLRGNVLKSLEPLAKKHKTTAKAMADILKRANLWIVV